MDKDSSKYLCKHKERFDGYKLIKVTVLYQKYKKSTFERESMTTGSHPLPSKFHRFENSIAKLHYS